MEYSAEQLKELLQPNVELEFKGCKGGWRVAGFNIYKLDENREVKEGCAWITIEEVLALAETSDTFFHVYKVNGKRNPNYFED